MKTKIQKAIFAAGCFWGIEAAFSKLEGVISTRVGYTGGDYINPTYEEVSSGRTGHAESVEIIFNPAIISYKKLLEIFWKVHDPTTRNKQGYDIGSQYRSMIFYFDNVQKNEALESRKELERSKRYKNPIVTEIVPVKEFYEAEEYHQKYLEKRGI